MQTLPAIILFAYCQLMTSCFNLFLAFHDEKAESTLAYTVQM